MMVNITAVHNRVALVTGGVRGLGKDIVLKLAEEGYSMAINYNSSTDRIPFLKSELDKLGIEYVFVKADISIENQVKNMVDEVLLKFKHIDVLVNNSAVCIDSLFEDKTVENFRKTLDVNVIGTFLVSKYVGNAMWENKSGKIINISSTNGINTYFPMCIDYDASKSAIISLTHNLAIQFAPYIQVNAIAPGFIATESEINGMDEEFIKSEEEKILLKRVGQPKEVAQLVSFLASSNADYINNSVIRIDGGMYGS